MTAQSKDYARGYAAGRKRGGLTSDQLRFDLFLSAAMQGILAGTGPWSADGKRDSSATDYARTANELARALMKHRL